MGNGGFCTKNAKFFYFFEKKFSGGNWGGGFGRETKKSRTLSVFHSRPPPFAGFPRKRESRGAAWSARHCFWGDIALPLREFPAGREEIPAFAGMEYGEGINKVGDSREVFFYLPINWGGTGIRPACTAFAGCGAGVARTQKSGDSRFRGNGEIPAFAGMEYGEGMEMLILGNVFRCFFTPLFGAVAE